MKQKTFLIVYAVIITLILCAGAYVGFRQFNESSKSYEKTIEDRKEQETLTYNRLTGAIRQNFQIAGTSLSESASLELIDTLKHKIRLKDLLAEDKIILFISQLHCSDCVGKEMKFISEILKQKPTLKDKIKIIIHSVEGNYFENFRRFNKVNADLYNANNNYLKTSFDQYGAPFIIYAAKDLDIKFGCLSDRNFSEITNAFYERAMQNFIFPKGHGN